MDTKTVFINADTYSRILLKYMQGSSDWGDWGSWSDELDESLGIELIGEDTDVYSFRVDDEMKWMMAKIKWGL
jgi:hypothetical protein